eukprot:1668083-Rhodomonas_salina.2
MVGDIARFQVVPELTAAESDAVLYTWYGDCVAWMLPGLLLAVCILDATLAQACWSSRVT